MTGNEKLRQHVQARLREHRELDSSGIEVEVERRVIKLRGTVEDARLKSLVESVAASAPGVLGVKNELRVKGDWGEERAALKTEFGSKEAAQHEKAAGFDRIT